MGKRILITGCNKGLGYGLVSKLLNDAPEFDKIIMTARNNELGLSAKSSLKNDPRLDYHILDVTSLDSISNIRDYIASTYGTIDILVNNAAILNRNEENKHSLIRSHTETNFYGLKSMTDAFLPLLAPGGHIINFSSGLGKTCNLNNPALASRFLDPNLTMNQVVELADEFYNIGHDWAEKGWDIRGFGVYCVTKALVNSFTRVLARDLAALGSGIRVNALSPGWVKTDMGTSDAVLTLEEGLAVPFRLVRDTSGISGKYWYAGGVDDFS